MSNLSNGLATELNTLLEEELAAVQALESLLEEERQALTKYDTNKLEDVILRKVSHLEALDDISARKVALLSSHSYSLETDSFRQIIAPSKALTHLFDEISLSLQHCQHLNNVNGAITQMSQSQLDRTMSLIFGEPDITLYSDKAKTYSSRSGMTFDEA